MRGDNFKKKEAVDCGKEKDVNFHLYFPLINGCRKVKVEISILLLTLDPILFHFPMLVPVGHALQPALAEELLKPSQGIEIYVPLSMGCTAAAPKLESWIELGLSS